MMNTSYRIAYQQASVNTASPGKLLVMLYDGLIRFTTIAENALDAHDYESAHKAFIRAQEIVLELKATLNKSVAPELCESLEALYDYFYGQLVTANVNKSTDPLEGVVDNVRQIRNAFEAAEQTLLQERQG